MITLEEAKEYSRYLDDRGKKNLKWDLAKMEFLAGLLGSNWKAPEIEGRCTAEDRRGCIERYGKENIDYACENCPRNMGL